MAIGGVQHLEMSYDYHISILESPVPFKTGVDISNEGADFSFKVTKAKYRGYFTEKEHLKDKADTLIINKKNNIVFT